jgi:hypothetical protein
VLAEEEEDEERAGEGGRSLGPLEEGRLRLVR